MCCACVLCHRLFITFKTVKSDDVIFKQSIKAYVTFVLTILVWTRLDNFLFYFCPQNGSHHSDRKLAYF